MTPSRYQQIGDLYLAALELDRESRIAFLDEACAGDLSLREEVESLLSADQQAGDFISSTALEEIAGELAMDNEDELTGKRFSHYTILSLLGSGGMAEVYLAEDVRLPRKVALKLLPAAFAQDADRGRRFAQEARTVSALNHPNIVTIYEIGRYKGRQYIASELVEGETLRDRLSSELHLSEAVDVAIQVATALNAAHAAGVVHRDIKPENIMLRPDGYVKVLDFGLAKLVAGESAAKPSKGKISTTAGIVLGTVGYMSPEQARGQRVDPRTDLFSLGAVLYEMVSGQSPFAAATTADTIVAILSKAETPLCELASNVPAALERIVSKSLAKPCDQRYQSAQELLDDLRAVNSQLEFGLSRGTRSAASNPDFSDSKRFVESASEIKPGGLWQAPSSSSTALRLMLEPIGGAVPLDSDFYVVRATDEKFSAAIRRQDSIVLVKGARQVGKTSLLARGLEQARQAGARVVLTDLQNISADALTSIDKLLLALAECFADQLDLEVFPVEVWKHTRSAVTNFEQYLRREVLLKVDVPIVWGLDEVDRLFSCQFGSEVFGLFRSWHNKRALDPAGPWRRLTLAIAYATEAHLFITDLNQSPFNVGTRLLLEDFTCADVDELNRRYGSPLKDKNEIDGYFDLLSGQPYLVRRGLYEMVTSEIGFAALEGRAGQEEGPFGDHLRRMLISMSQDSELCESVRSILEGKSCHSTESFYRLRTAGLLVGDSARDARLRCRLYADYLRRHLL